MLLSLLERKFDRDVASKKYHSEDTRNAEGNLLHLLLQSGLDGGPSKGRRGLLGTCGEGLGEGVAGITVRADELASRARDSGGELTVRGPSTDLARCRA